MKGITQITALYGLLVALAFLFSFVESLLPLPLPFPGIKLGLANGVVLVALYRLGGRPALAVSLVRLLLAGLTFGSPATMLYSVAGGLCSFGVMWLCRRVGWFSPFGVSMAGGVAHNMAQLGVAALVMDTVAVAWYVPVLLAAGLATGGLLGWLCCLLLTRLDGRKKARIG